MSASGIGTAQIQQTPGSKPIGVIICIPLPIPRRLARKVDASLPRRTSFMFGIPTATVCSTLADHPLAGEAHIVGFIGALELVADKATRTFFEPLGDAGRLCRDICFENL